MASATVQVPAGIPDGATVGLYRLAEVEPDRRLLRAPHATPLDTATVTVDGKASFTYLDGRALPDDNYAIHATLNAGGNLCTNPSAATNTTGWTSVSATTFERVTSLPTLSGLPADVTTGFHLVTAGDAQGAFDDVAVESGKTYQFSAYVYLDTSTATGVRLQVRNAGGTVKATSAPFSTLDDWGRIEVPVTADATGAWQFRVRQSGGGGADWYFTAVEIEEQISGDRQERWGVFTQGNPMRRLESERNRRQREQYHGNSGLGIAR